MQYWKKNLEGINERCHEHCWHAFRGPIWMVIPDGHILQKCCGCDAKRTIHIDHAYEHRKERFWCAVKESHDAELNLPKAQEL